MIEDSPDIPVIVLGNCLCGDISRSNPLTIIIDSTAVIEVKKLKYSIVFMYFLKIVCEEIYIDS